MDNMNRYYKILEVGHNASEKELRQAYRDMLAIWHPDRFMHNARLQGKAQEKAKLINEAYEKIQSFRNNKKIKVPRKKSEAKQSRPKSKQTGRKTKRQRAGHGPGKEEKRQPAEEERLIFAARYGNVEAINNLIQAEVKVDARDGDGSTALMIASELGYIDSVKYLLRGGADYSITGGEHGQTALMFAASGGHISIVQVLLEKGADVNAVNSGGNMEPRYFTIGNITINAAEYSLGENGRTALMFAAQEGRSETIKTLLNAGAEINARNDKGSTALIIAADERSADAAAILLENGADVNAKNKDGKTALICVARTGQPKIVEALLNKKAKVDAKTKHGDTALILAANGCITNFHASEGEYTEVIRTLLERGAKVNAAGEGGQTALMAAVFSPHVHIIKTLIEYGANLEQKDKQGRTALMWAKEKPPSLADNSEVIQCLREAGATE